LLVDLLAMLIKVLTVPILGDIVPLSIVVRLLLKEDDFSDAASS
jgi:hypothetical protein